MVRSGSSAIGRRPAPAVTLLMPSGFVAASATEPVASDAHGVAVPHRQLRVDTHVFWSHTGRVIGSEPLQIIRVSCRIEYELPMKDEYGAFVGSIVLQPQTAGGP